MAYVNVAEWSPDQVSEWLKGLDDVILPYIHYFVNNQVDGKRLLQLSHDELPSLHVTKIGHQEIILQGVELLRNIHYHLHQENVQYLALRLSSKARSIYNELRMITPSSRGGGGSAGEDDEGDDDDDDGAGGNSDKKKQERVSTAVIAGVADVLSSVKGVVSWLNRQPFEGVEQYDNLKGDLVELSIRLATIAQRDLFAENQATVILQSCLKLANFSDKIIQEYSDPLIIQPASLDVATIKKKADDDWGVVLLSSYHGVHQVSGVRALSPAHQCGKLHEGDELVQVNYQTMVGWAPHKVATAMQEFPVEVILTVKKRPNHSNIGTQIYFKPFRLPSKKRTYSPWASSVVSSPRYDLQSIPNLQLSVSVDKTLIRHGLKGMCPRSLTPTPVHPTPPPQPVSTLSSEQRATTSDSEQDDNSDFDESDSDVGGSSPISMRLYHPKPRIPVQRRATIPGATTRPSFNFDQILQDKRWQRGGRSPDRTAPSDPDLRGTGGSEQRIARPHTCIGTENKERHSDAGDEPPVEEHDAQELKSLDRNIDRPDGSKEAASAPQESPDSSKEKRIVNVIPLPPRKPAGQTVAPVIQEPSSGLTQEVSALNRGAQTVSSTNVNALTPAKGQGSSRKDSQGSSRKEKAPQGITIEKSLTSQELKLELSPRQRKVSEDRPKLDKSHSTPAYDLEETEAPSAVPTLTPIAVEKSPATQVSSPCFFGSDSKNLFTVIGVGGGAVGGGGGGCGGGVVGQDKGGPGTTIITTATTNVGSDATHHFKSQVIFPMSAPTLGVAAVAPNATQVEGSDTDDKPNTDPDSRTRVSSSTGGGDGGSEGGGGGGGVEGEHHSNPKSTSEPSAVVLRETRSSSPSVWRRGLVVDQGSRRISCRELGRGDHQGWLLRRRDNKGFLLPHRWERRWFILKKNYLYGYRDREAVRADSLIYLPGFHVCPAPAVKSKKFAFKIYHSSGATFYFACETTEERSRWMSQMGLSAISSGNHQRHHQHHNTTNDDVYYSETDDEMDERTSPSRRSSQSPQSRISPTKEIGSCLWRGSGSPGQGSAPRSANLPSTKGPGLRFLQHSRDTLAQPVPTASYRSYRRVSESGNRSTSTGDLRGGGGRPEATEISHPDIGGGNESGPTRRLTRKNSLRDRLRQLPASLTLERRKQTSSKSNQPLPTKQDKQPHKYKQNKEDKCSPSSLHHEDIVVNKTDHSSHGETVHMIGGGKEQQQQSQEVGRVPDISGGATHTSPTRPGSGPVRPSSLDLDPRTTSPSRSAGTRWNATPPPSGRSSPSKLDPSGRRGSTGGGESPVRSRSPRRGSLDCLASSRRALSPPLSPLHTPTRSSHGSASSLLASEEYREGSPEKLWINSLRSDSSRPRPTTRSSPEKREGRARSGSGDPPSDRLKHTALYHPLQLRNKDPLRATFELNLDPTTSTFASDTSKARDQQRLSAGSASSSHSSKEHSESKSAITSPRKQTRDVQSGRAHSTLRPEVPPRTKFLSPSERTLPSGTPASRSSSSVLQASPSSSSLSSTSIKSFSSVSSYSSLLYSQASPDHLGHIAHGTSQARSTKPVPNLNIRPLTDEGESLRTPLKPAMGVSMIGKQRRTPGILSPRDVFFASPPSSPTTPFSPSIPPLLSPSPTTSTDSLDVPITSHQTSQPSLVRTTNAKGQQKILPHYPGMEYPPVFEPGSYSLCGSPPESIYHLPGTPSAPMPGTPTTSIGDYHSLDLENSPRANTTANSSVPVQPGVFLANVASSDTEKRSSPRSMFLAGRESKAQLNVYVSGPSNSAGYQGVQESNGIMNIVVPPLSSSRSHQNLYVSAPNALRSQQNLYGSTASSQQNVYVSTPTRTTMKQCSEITKLQQLLTARNEGSSVASKVPQTTAAQCNSYQNVFVTNIGGVEVKEQHKFPCNINSTDKAESHKKTVVTKSPSRPHGPPRLVLPGPPETPPCDDEGDLTTTSTQTDS